MESNMEAPQQISTRTIELPYDPAILYLGISEEMGGYTKTLAHSCSLQNYS
jgi:hypothetical protein